MANEVKVTAGLKADNGNFAFHRPSATISFNQTNGRGGNPGSVQIGTSEEDVSFGDLTTPGWYIFRNLDATNFVDYGPKSGGVMVPFGRLLPNKGVGLGYLYPGAVVRMKADTAACWISIEALDV